MKATLEFNLPDDQLEFDMVVKASSYYSCVFDLDQLWCRWKHSENEPTGQEVLDAIRETINEHGITI